MQHATHSTEGICGIPCTPLYVWVNVDLISLPIPQGLQPLKDPHCHLPSALWQLAPSRSLCPSRQPHRSTTQEIYPCNWRLYSIVCRLWARQCPSRWNDPHSRISLLEEPSYFTQSKILPAEFSNHWAYSVPAYCDNTNRDVYFNIEQHRNRFFKFHWWASMQWVSLMLVFFCLNWHPQGQ